MAAVDTVNSRARGKLVFGVGRGGGRAHVRPSALASTTWSSPWGQLHSGDAWIKFQWPLMAAGLTELWTDGPS